MDISDTEILEMATVLVLKGKWQEILFYKRIKKPFHFGKGFIKMEGYFIINRILLFSGTKL